MIKTAYIDCFSGLSGDMFLGALIDLGLNGEDLFEELKGLGLHGYTVKISRESRHEISGTRVKISCEHTHEHRTLSDIKTILDASRFPEGVTTRSMKMFHDLVKAEAKVHGASEENVVLHEVGAVDAMLDIVGTCLAIHKLGIQDFIASPVPLGSGTIKSQHGVLPVPAPATAILLENIPCYATQTMGELTTPTGATIVKNIARIFGPMPLMTLDKTGYGVGSKEFRELPNVLRIITGFTDAPAAAETVTVIQANIDDQNPQQLPYLMDRLFEKGALDVFWTPIQMKKNRPGFLVEVISPFNLAPELMHIILKESTTIGLRYYQVSRIKLDRKTIAIKTKWGDVRLKIAYKDTTNFNMSPEYEDCAKIARDSGIPLKEVYLEVIRNSHMKDES